MSSINVNLHAWPDANPVLIALSLDAFRSVTFEVRLGECRCHMSWPAGWERLGYGEGEHDTVCPAWPIRVTCSIGGDTWDASKPVDFESADLSGEPPLAAIAACRERWSLVKALVTGQPQAQPGGKWLDAPTDLFTQRDAVFAALADMRRAEKAAHTAFLALSGDLRKASIISKQCGTVAADPDGGGIDLPSAMIFAVYVSRLIEQVGALS